MELDIVALNEAIKKESQFVDRAFAEISKVVVGQQEMVEGIIMGLLTGGHVLLEGAGVSKDVNYFVSVAGHLAQFSTHSIYTGFAAHRPHWDDDLQSENGRVYT